jgi:LPS-assembly lipoprotein
MSWSKGSWSPFLLVLAALALSGGLAGCFQPLYSEAAHPGLVEDLRAIEVEPIKDRIGHYLADNLTTDLNGTGQTPPPKYRLTVTVTTASSTPTVNSLINVATSATMTGEAHYTLNKVDGGAQVLTGVANANATYDRSQQRYNDLRAARDAEIRMARSLSEEISLRLAAQLAAKKTS